MVILYSRTIAIWPVTTSPEVRIMSLLFLENWIAFVVVREDGKGMCLQVKSDPRLERVPIMYRRAANSSVTKYHPSATYSKHGANIDGLHKVKKHQKYKLHDLCPFVFGCKKNWKRNANN